MSRRLMLALALVLATSTDLRAQLRPGDPGYKDPGMAILVEVLVTGGGHFYAGETKRGLALLGGSVGAIVAGAVATLATSDFCEGEFGYGDSDPCDDQAEDINWAPFAVGVVAALGIKVYGLVDAPAAARRSNTRRVSARPRAEPIIATGRHGETRVGLRLAYTPGR
jgi:hypothetical protein